MSILVGILTILLVFLSLFLILIVLMQRGSANGGLGAAMGGGMAESALGAEAANTLSRLTTRVAVAFFVLVFGTYLLQLKLDHSEAAGGSLPEFESSAAPASTEDVISDLLGGSGSSLEAATSDAEQAAKDLEAAAAEKAAEAKKATDGE